MLHDFCISYKNIKLRPLVTSDIESLRIWRNNPQNSKFLRKIPFITKEMQIEWYRNYLDNSDEICFAIEEVECLNRVVGSLSLYGFNNDYCFLGKILVGDDAAHGKGIGTNAAIAASNFAFIRLNFNEVRLHVFSDNIAGKKIYERAGFHVVNVHTDKDGKQECTMSKFYKR